MYPSTRPNKTRGFKLCIFPLFMKSMIFTFGVLVFSLLILKSECYPYPSDLISSKRQCSCDHKSVASFRGGSDRRTSVASVQNIASNRRACHFYLWNAQSALLSRWCNHLQKDNIYEGRGGKKVGVSYIAFNSCKPHVIVKTNHSD